MFFPRHLCLLFEHIFPFNNHIPHGAEDRSEMWPPKRIYVHAEAFRPKHLGMHINTLRRIFFP